MERNMLYRVAVENGSVMITAKYPEGIGIFPERARVLAAALIAAADFAEGKPPTFTPIEV